MEENKNAKVAQVQLSGYILNNLRIMMEIN